MIITFEGGEGVGKTTQAALLKEYLQNKGRLTVSLRDPGGTRLSEGIRRLFLDHSMDEMTGLMLLLAARRNNISTVIRPALEEGKIIIIDRFIDSTLVYQGIAGGLGIDKVESLMELTGTMIEPDLTFLMDMDPETAYRRFTPSDRLETRGLKTQKEIREGFLEVCREKRHHVINADAPKEIIFERIKEIVLNTDPKGNT